MLTIQKIKETFHTSDDKARKFIELANKAELLNLSPERALIELSLRLLLAEVAMEVMVETVTETLYSPSVKLSDLN